MAQANDANVYRSPLERAHQQIASELDDCEIPNGTTTKPRRLLVRGRSCVDTGAVIIGRAVAMRPTPPTPYPDCLTLQAAVLDARTARKPSPVARFLGALWRLA